MAAVQGPQAVELALWDQLAARVGDAAVNLYTAAGAVPWPLANGTHGAALAVARFREREGRLPAALFNDGKVGGQSLPLVGWETRQVQTGTSPETGDVLSSVLGWPMLQATPAAGDLGAVPNWLLLVAAASQPEFIVATDAGLMLTPGGVWMVRRSLTWWYARWLERVKGWADGDLYGAGVVPMREVFYDGPVLLGVPLAMLESAYARYEAGRRGGLLADVVGDLLRLAAFFGSFSAGAAGLSQLVAGTVSMQSLSGVVRLADQVGIDTGNLSALASLAGNLTRVGASVFNAINDQGAIAISNQVPVDDFDFTDYDPDFIDPGTIDYGWSAFDPFEGVDWSAVDDLDIDAVDWDALGDFDEWGAPVVWDMGDTGSVQIPGGAAVTITAEQAATAAAAPHNPAVVAAARELVARSLGTTVQAAQSQPSVWSRVVSMGADLVKVAGAWYAAKNQQAITTRPLTGGGAVSTYTNGTRTLTYPDGRTVTVPTYPAASASLIPGISNQTLIIGGAVVLGALVLTSALRR